MRGRFPIASDRREEETGKWTNPVFRCRHWGTSSLLSLSKKVVVDLSRPAFISWSCVEISTTLYGFLLYMYKRRKGGTLMLPRVECRRRRRGRCPRSKCVFYYVCPMNNGRTIIILPRLPPIHHFDYAQIYGRAST